MKFSNPENYIIDYSKSYNRKYETNDCVVIAFAILFGISYDEAHGFSRGFFDRPERNGPLNFEKSMDRMIRNPNFRFNGDVKKITLQNQISALQVTEYFSTGIYLALTMDHVSVLSNGVWIDYRGIMKPKTKVIGLYKFSNFKHLENFNTKKREEDSPIDLFMWGVAAFIAFLFILNLTNKGHNDLRMAKHWIKEKTSIYLDF